MPSSRCSTGRRWRRCWSGSQSPFSAGGTGCRNPGRRSHRNAGAQNPVDHFANPNQQGERVMEVILLERVAKLGQMGEVVRVKDGFARNFLLPKGKALRATK